MIATAFLGFLKIAPNDPNLLANININSNNNNKNKGTAVLHEQNSHNNELRIRRGFNSSNNHINKKHYSTSSNNLPDKKNTVLTEFIKFKNLNPIHVYENLQENYTRKLILSKSRGISGVYLILNKITLDYYIGSAATNKFNSRFSNHLINFHGSKVVKNAVKKYGLSSFAFLILELFPYLVTKENNKKLLDIEDFYLKTLLPNYNILTEAGSSFGYKHTDITRINLKTNYSEECRAFAGNINRGKSSLPETIELIREKSLSRERPNYSKKAIANMKNKSKPILVQNLDRTVHGEFASIVETAKSISCSEKTVIRALKSPKKMLKKR